jgi:hypothetical protein
LLSFLTYFTVEYWRFHHTGHAKITPDRIQYLDRLGFCWDPQTEQWQIMYRRLEHFVSQNGHARVPKGYKADRALAHWVRNQRLDHRAGRLTKERVELLGELGFVWNPSSSCSSNGSGTQKSNGE